MRKPGDPALPGAGRPEGAPNKNVILPPIHVDKMPFKVGGLRKGMSAAEFWDMQSPRVLSYLFKRFNMYLVYEAKGIYDPVGAKIFNLLGKPLMKEIVRQSKKAEDCEPPGLQDDGKEIKAFKKSLLTIHKSLSTTAEPFEENSTEGEYTPDDLEVPGVAELGDEF